MSLTTAPPAATATRAAVGFPTGVQLGGSNTGESTQSPDRLQVLLELRHARLRLEIVACEIDWARSLLSAGQINAEGALQVMEDALDQLGGIA